MEKDKQEKIIKKALRMDFIQEIIYSQEHENGTIEFKAVLKPDPKKYDTVEIEGEIFFKDKFTNDLIPFKLLQNMNITEKIPIFYTPPKEENLCEYLKKGKMN